MSHAETIIFIPGRTVGKGVTMLEYHAAYYPIEDGWYMAKVLDFPGAVSQGRTLRSARKMIRDSLAGLAEYVLAHGEALPLPNSRAKDKSAVFEERLQLDVRVFSDDLYETPKASAASAAKRVHLRGRRR